MTKTIATSERELRDLRDAERMQQSIAQAQRYQPQPLYGSYAGPQPSSEPIVTAGKLQAVQKRIERSKVKPGRPFSVFHCWWQHPRDASSPGVMSAE